MTDSFGFQLTSLYAPDPAEFAFSQALPRSPSFWLASATFFSTTDAITDVIRLRTMVGAYVSTMVNFNVWASGAVISLPTLSLVQPSWLIRKAGVLSICTTRCSENAASSAVTGAPLWNFRPLRSLKVKSLPSGLMVQLSATPPTIFLRSSAS